MAFELKAFYSKIYRTYDLVNRLFTFGMDGKWRKATAKRCLEKKPLHVLDLCCGTGDLTVSLSKYSHDKQLKVVGYDFSQDMLKVAEVKAGKKGLKNTNFIEGDAASLPFDDSSFDSLTIGFGFRNLTYENPAQQQHIAEMNRVLRKGGELLILESGVPENPIVKFFYKLYIYVFLVALGTIISGNAKAYWYLARSSSRFYTIDEVSKILKESGFSKVESRKFFLGAANLFVATK